MGRLVRIGYRVIDAGTIFHLIDRVIDWGIISLLIFTPLAFGAVEPWAQAVVLVVVLGIACLWFLKMTWRGEVRVEIPPGTLPAGLFLLLVGLQLTPLPAALIGWMSPARLAIQAEAERAMAEGGAVGPMLLSLDPVATQSLFWELVTVAVFFLVAYNTLRSPHQVRRVIWTMVLSGAFLAVFGIVQRATWNGRLYWLRPLTDGADPFGPYVNRTHLAGLVLIIIPVALGYFLSRPGLASRGDRYSWFDRLVRMRPREAMRRFILPFLTLIMVAALLISRSRGAMVSFVAALLLMVLWLAIRRVERRPAWQVAGFLAGAFLFTVWIAADVLLGTTERLAAELADLEGSTRIGVWREAMSLWAQFPLFGTGLGTFGAAFRLVRTVFPGPVAFTHAESDYIQLLTDTGILGLVLAVWVAGALVVAGIKEWQGAQSRHAKGLALGGLIALVGTLVQGIGNYNLVVMANYLYLAVGLTLMLKAAGLER